MVERQLPKLHTGVRFPSPAYPPLSVRHRADKLLGALRHFTGTACSEIADSGKDLTAARRLRLGLPQAVNADGLLFAL